VKKRTATALAGSCGDLAHLALEDQLVARPDLAPEAGFVDPPEQWQLALESFVAQDRERTHLGDRLAHQHAWQRRPARKVAGEEPLVTRQLPPPARRLARHDFEDLVDEEERRAVRTASGRN